MSKKIKIFATSDVHGVIYPYQYANQKEANHGLSRLSTYLQQHRDEYTLVFDNGDILEGSPLTYYHGQFHQDQIHPMTQALNHMGYTHINLGNHDFNYGKDMLYRHLQQANAKCVTCNILDQQKPIAQYDIQVIHGKTIAIFGLTTQYIPHWEQPSHIEQMEFLDPVEIAKQTIAHLQQHIHPDYIICLYHGGFENDLQTDEPTEIHTKENQGSEILEQVIGLDILITGHQHRSLCGIKNGIVYTQTAANATEMAYIEIDLDQNQITPTLIAATSVPDHTLMALLQQEEDACQIWLDQPLGTTTMDLEVHDEFDARLHKHQVITFLNRVQLAYSHAQLSASALFLNATGFKKQITMRDLVSTYVYPNTLVVKEIRGDALKQYLEKTAEFWSIQDQKIIVHPSYDYPKPQHFNYDMIDGIEYTIKVSNPVGQRIVQLTYQQKPVLDDDVFTICVNNYRASGGGNYPMVQQAKTVQDDQVSMVEILAKYIQENQVIQFTPVHNIRVIQ